VSVGPRAYASGAMRNLFQDIDVRLKGYTPYA